MANRQITYGIGFNVDSSGLNQLRQELSRIQTMTTAEYKIFNPDMESKSFEEVKGKLKEVQLVAKQVETAISNSFNPKLNSINLQNFDKELKKVGLTVPTVSKSFSQLGDYGRQAFTNLTTSVLTANKEIKATWNLAQKLGDTFANTIRWSITSGAINSVTGAIQKAWGYTQKLDSSLNDIRIVTEKSADEMERFAKQANKAAKELGASTTSYSNAALIYYQQGLEEEDVQARTQATVKAANVTGQSAAEVSEQLTAVWNGYKVVASEAETYVDKLAAVAATTAADLEELSDGMSKVSSSANAMGVDIDQLSAQLATVVSVTRQDASLVGTALKTIYARMGDLKVSGVDEFGTSLGDVSSQMRQMGIEVLDQEGNLREMGEVIEEVASKWEDWTGAQKQAAAIAIAGKRQYNNLISLFDNWDMYESALTTSQTSEGTLQKQQNIYMESLEARLQRLATAGEKVYDAIFDSESMKDMIDALAFLTEGFANFIQSIGGGGNALLLLGRGFSALLGPQIAKGVNVLVQNTKAYFHNLNQEKLMIEYLTPLKQAGIDMEIKGQQKVIKLKEEQIRLQKYMTKEELEASNQRLLDIAKINQALMEQEASLAEINQAYVDEQGIEDKTTSKAGVEGRSEKTGQFREKGFNIRQRIDFEIEGLDTFDEEYEKIQEKFKNLEKQVPDNVLSVLKQRDNLEEKKQHLETDTKGIEEVRQKAQNLDFKDDEELDELSEKLERMEAAEQELKIVTDELKKKELELQNIYKDDTKADQTKEIVSEYEAFKKALDESIVSYKDFIKIKRESAENFRSDATNLDVNLLNQEKADAAYNAAIEGISLERRKEKKDGSISVSGTKTNIEGELFLEKGKSKPDTERIQILEKELQLMKNLEAAQKKVNISKNASKEIVKKLYESNSKDLNLSEEQHKKLKSIIGSEENYNKLLDVLEKNTKELTAEDRERLKVLQETARMLGLIAESQDDDANNTEEARNKAQKDVDERNLKEKQEKALKEQVKIQEITAGITNVIGSITTLIGVVQTFIGLGDIWQNQDLTTGEKVGQTITAILGALLALIPIFLPIVGGLLAIKSGADAATVSFFGMSGAAWMSLGPYLPIVLAVVAGLAALVGIIIAVKAAFEQIGDNGKKAFEDASKAAQGAAEEFNQVKSAYDELKAAFEDYSSAQKAIEEMTAGTQEWRDAIQEANMQVLDLIDKYPELAQYVSDVDGQLKISEKGQQEILKAESKKVSIAQQAQLATKQQELLAKNNMIAQQGAADDLNADKVASKGIWSGIGQIVAGSLAGTALAAITGGVGTFLGGASLATGLAASGAASIKEGYNYQEQADKAYTVVSDIISEEGNSIIYDNERFIKKLEESGITNKDLINALIENKKEVAKNAMEIAANTSAIKLMEKQQVENYLEANNQTYQNASEAERSQISAITARLKESSKLDEELKKEYYGSNETLNKSELKDVAKEYAELMGIEYVGDIEVDKAGQSFTYKDSEGNERVVNGAAAVAALVENAEFEAIVTEESVQRMQDALDVTVTAMSKQFGDKVGEAVANVVAGGDLSSLGQSDYESLQKQLNAYSETSNRIAKNEKIIAETQAELDAQAGAQWYDWLTLGISEAIQHSDDKKDKAAIEAAQQAKKNDRQAMAEAFGYASPEAFEQSILDMGYESIDDYFNELEKASENYQKEVDKLGSGLSATVRTSYDNLENIIGTKQFGELSLSMRKTIASGLESAFTEGGSAGLEAFQNILATGKLNETELNEILNIFNNIDWSSSDAVNQFSLQVEKAGINTTDLGTAWDAFLTAMEGAENTVQNVINNLDSLRQTLAELSDIIDDINIGDIISDEEYEKLISKNKELEKFFIKTAEGFAYIGGAGADAALKVAKNNVLDIDKIKSDFEKAEKVGQEFLKSSAYINIDDDTGAVSIKSGSDKSFQSSLRNEKYQKLLEASGINQDKYDDSYEDAYGRSKSAIEGYESFSLAKISGYKTATELAKAQSGLTEEEWNALSDAERQKRISQAQLAQDDASERKAEGKAYIEEAASTVLRSLNAINNGEWDQMSIDAQTSVITAQVSSYKELIALNEDYQKSHNNEDIIESTELNKLKTMYLAQEAEALGISAEVWEKYIAAQKDFNKQDALLENWRLKALYSEIDAYADLNAEISRTEKTLEELESAQEKAFGQDALDNLEAQITAQKELQKTYEKQAKRQQKEWEAEAASLEVYTSVVGEIQYNEDGTISDTFIENLLNKLIADPDANDGTLKEAYNAIIGYNETVLDGIADNEQAIADAREAVFELELEKFNKEFELIDQARDTLKEWQDFRTEMAKVLGGAKGGAAFGELSFEEQFTSLKNNLTELFGENNLDLLKNSSKENKDQPNIIETKTEEIVVESKPASETEVSISGSKVEEKESKVEEIIVESEPNAIAEIEIEEPDVQEIEPKIETIEPETQIVEPKIETIEPESQTIEPNLEILDTDPQIIEPNIEVSEPEEKIVELNIEVSEPNETVIEPNIEVEEPDKTIIEPNIEVEEPEKENIEPEIEVSELDVQEITPEIEVEEPDKTIVEPEIEISEPDKTIIEPEIEVEDPDTQKITSNIEVEEPEEKVIEPEIKVEEPESVLDENDFSGLLKIRELQSLKDNPTAENNPFYDENGTFNEAAFNEQMGEAISTAQDQVTEAYDSLYELYELWLNGVEELSALYQDQIDKLSNVNSLLSGSASLWKLVGKRIEGASDAVRIANEGMVNASINSAEIARRQAAALKVQYEEIKDSAEYSDEQKEAIYSAYMEAQQSALDLASEAVNKVSEVFADNIALAVDDALAEVADNRTLAMLNEDWSRATAYDERYLDEVNTAYAMDELDRNFQKSIDETDNIAAQNKLKQKQMEIEQRLNKILDERGKLSQAEIDRANAEYELTLKQIALEEAQRTASKMKLVRDSQGNYTYQYVADQDAVAEAEAEVAAAENDLYNLEKDQQKTAISDWFAMLQQAQTDIASAQTTGDAGYVEKVIEYYRDSLSKLQSEVTENPSEAFGEYANIIKNFDVNSLTADFNTEAESAESKMIELQTTISSTLTEANEIANAELDAVKTSMTTLETKAENITSKLNEISQELLKYDLSKIVEEVNAAARSYVDVLMEAAGLKKDSEEGEDDPTAKAIDAVTKSVDNQSEFLKINNATLETLNTTLINSEFVKSLNFEIRLPEDNGFNDISVLSNDNPNLTNNSGIISSPGFVPVVTPSAGFSYAQGKVSRFK